MILFLLNVHHLNHPLTQGRRQRGRSNFEKNKGIEHINLKILRNGTPNAIATDHL